MYDTDDRIHCNIHTDNLLSKQCFDIKMEIFVFTKERVATMTCKAREYVSRHIVCKSIYLASDCC
jgi:hypothetical protein